MRATINPTRIWTYIVVHQSIDNEIDPVGIALQGQALRRIELLPIQAFFLSYLIGLFDVCIRVSAIQE